MSNILDLKKKEIKIVEKIIVKKRIWWIESLKMLGVLAITIGVTWAISNAEIFTGEDKEETVSNPVEQKIKKFSAIGIVSGISDTSLSLKDAEGTVDKSVTSFTFDLSSVSKIETKSYDPLSLSGIKIGDKIIVQGTLEDEEVTITRVISFGAVTPVLEVAPEIIPPLEPQPSAETPDVILPEDLSIIDSTHTEPSPSDEPIGEVLGEEIPADEPPTPEVLGESNEEPQPEEVVETPEEESTSETPEEEQVVETPPEVTIPEDEPVVDETPEEVPPVE